MFWSVPKSPRTPRSVGRPVRRELCACLIGVSPMLVCRYASSPGLALAKNTPAIDTAIYHPIGTSYQLQLSFHPHSTEPEPTARARRAREEFYKTTPEFMFVSFRLLGIDSILAASATVSMIMYSVRVARNCDSAGPRFYTDSRKSWTCDYQRRHHPGGP